MDSLDRLRGQLGIQLPNGHGEALRHLEIEVIRRNAALRHVGAKGLQLLLERLRHLLLAGLVLHDSSQKLAGFLLQLDGLLRKGPAQLAELLGLVEQPPDVAMDVLVLRRDLELVAPDIIVRSNLGHAVLTRNEEKAHVKPRAGRLFRHDVATVQSDQRHTHALVFPRGPERIQEDRKPDGFDHHIVHTHDQHLQLPEQFEIRRKLLARRASLAVGDELVDEYSSTSFWTSSCGILESSSLRPENNWPP